MVTLAWTADRRAVALITPVPRGNLHILAIGTDRIGNLPYRLRFAKADAQALTEAVARVGRGRHRVVVQRLLLDDQATRRGIEGAFREAIATVGPQDTFVFFFAGFGSKILPGSSEPAPEGILYAYDSTQREPATDTIRATLLKSWLRRVQAKNKLLLIDACYGALFLENEDAAAAIAGGRDAAGVSRVNVLAIGSQSMAYESPDLGHGLLTKALLDGLAGKADEPADGELSAFEISAFARLRSRELARTHGPQEVLSSELGEDFVLGTSQPDTHDLLPPQILIETPSLSPEGDLIVGEGPFVLRGRLVSGDPATLSVNGSPVTLEGGRFEVALWARREPTLLRIDAVDDARNGTFRAIRVINLGGDTRGPVTGSGPSRGVEPVSPLTGQDTLPQRRDYALLFATDEYEEWGRLENPLFDAETISQRLRDTYGFQVEVVRTPRREDVLSALIQYQSKVYADLDQLLIFFGGHGTYDDRFADGFIVTRESPRELTIANDSKFIQHAVLFKLLDKIPCKHTLVIMDTCFGGQLLDAARGTPETTAQLPRSGSQLRRLAARLPPPTRHAVLLSPPLEMLGFLLQSPPYAPAPDDVVIRRKLRGKTRRLLTSGGKEYVPDGRPGHHSPFAAQLLAALESRGGDGLLTLDEIHAFLDRVDPEPRKGLFTADATGEIILIARPAE